MLSFHNDPKIKEKYLSRVISHRKADRIIQGTGWENGKGCAVGCTLENYDHSRYPIELGLPEWVAHLEDKIFEGLKKTDAMNWPEKFLFVIPVGIDIDKVKHRLAILRMERLISIQKNLLNKNYSEIDEIIKNLIVCINTIKSCHEAEINKNYCDWSAAFSAVMSFRESAVSSLRESWVRNMFTERERYGRESAGNSIMWAAESAADSASCSSPMSVMSSAWSAARSTAWWSGSGSEEAELAAWKQESEDLLKLLSECK